MWFLWQCIDMQNCRQKKRARNYTLPSIDNVQRRFILNIIVNILEFPMKKKMGISYFLLRFKLIISVALSLSL